METTTYISLLSQLCLWQFRFVCVVYWVGIPLIPGLTDSTGPSSYIPWLSEQHTRNADYVLLKNKEMFDELNLNPLYSKSATS